MDLAVEAIDTTSTLRAVPPIPIMVKIWAGGANHDYRYIKRSIPSLLASALPDGARVVLVDDLSTDQRVVRLMAHWAAADSRVELWRNPERMGPNRGQAYNFPRLVARFPDAEVFVLSDDDVVYHPGWLQRLITVYREAAATGLRGIFSALNVPAKPSYAEVQLPTSKVLLKERQMALNWLLPRGVYEQVGPFRDVGIAYDSDYQARTKVLGLPTICLQPSYVQNIGYFGAYQSSDELRAHDYVGTQGLWMRSRDVWFRVGHLVDSAGETALGRRIKPLVKPALKPLIERFWR